MGWNPLWRRLAGSVLAGGLLLASACGPLTPENDGQDNPAGNTADTFNITVVEWHEGPNPGAPVEGASVSVEFVDVQTIDPQTGQFTVRQTAFGATDPAGEWSTTVRYNGSGNLACDKVHYRVTHPEFNEHFEDLPIHNHKVTAYAELDRD